jgi:hypothetical protein
MEKHIVRWTFFLCLLCFAVALLWRVLMFFGIWLPGTLVVGKDVWYMSFYKAGVLFALVSIAAASYAQTMRQ